MQPQKPAASARPPSPNVAEFPDAPRIALCGQEWPIPRLAVRQNRVIEPRIFPLMTGLFAKYGSVQEILSKLKTSSDRDGLASVDQDVVKAIESFRALSDEEYDSALKIVGAALSRAHVEFRRGYRADDPDCEWVPTERPLLDMEISWRELLFAMPTIAMQSGLFGRKPGEEAAKTAGE